MLRSLSNLEMLAITFAWAHDPDARDTFLSIAEISPLHPKVVKVHADLLAIQPATDAASADVKKLVAAANRADVEHDALVRAVSAAIEADRTYCLAARPPQLARAEEAEEIHFRLFPTGMAIVDVSLLAEAGNAARIAGLLDADPSIAEYLDSIPLRDDHTALDLTRRWIAAGKKLGKLEHERSTLMVKGPNKALELVATSGVRARWLRLVAQVLSALELSDAPAEAIESVRGPVVRASERAEKRARAEAMADEGVDEGADDAMKPTAASA
jgi:hypothetical protein